MLHFMCMKHFSCMVHIDCVAYPAIRIRTRVTRRRGPGLIDEETEAETTTHTHPARPLLRRDDRTPCARLHDTTVHAAPGEGPQGESVTVSPGGLVAEAAWANQRLGCATPPLPDVPHHPRERPPAPFRRGRPRRCCLETAGPVTRRVKATRFVVLPGIQMLSGSQTGSQTSLATPWEVQSYWIRLFPTPTPPLTLRHLPLDLTTTW